jgi:hypothetical protein
MQLSRVQTINHWSNWFESRSEDWFYLTITLVFHRDQIGLNREVCEADYRTRILPKFQRRIERSPSNWSNALPFASELFYYERDETSIYKRIKYSSPHHIHGLLIVPKPRLYRVWSIDESRLADPMERDLRSMRFISDWLTEPVRDGELNHWLRYITKGGKQL